MAKDEKGHPRLLQVMSYLRARQSRVSQDSREASTVGHFADEMGMHKHGFHHCFTKGSREF